ncbi:MAG: Metal-dependent hydrolases of the beta-lactamase superfamily III, partial [uncultured Blastococcus sp.]
EAHRRRLLGQRSRPQVGRLLLPRRARRVPAGPRPGQRGVRCAADPRGPGEHRRGVPLAPARRPLPRLRAVRRLAPVLGPLVGRPGAALRPGRGRAAAGAGLRPRRRGGHRRLRLRAGGAWLVHARPVRRDAGAHRPSGRVLRHPAHRRRPVAGVHRRHGLVRARRRAGPRCRRAARRGRSPARPRPARRTAPHGARGRRARGRRGRRPAAAHPHPGLGRRDRPAVRRQRGLLRDRAGAPRRHVRHL